MKKIVTTAMAALLAVCLFAQTKENPWQDAAESSFAKKGNLRRIVPNKYRTLSLDLSLLQKTLDKAPMRFTPEADNWQPTLAIPMPDGTMQQFQIVEAPVMHPDLAAKYPYIRSFAGWSAADPTAYLRFGVTQEGFHGMILSARHGTVYIDAYAEGDSEHYLSYFKKDFFSTQPFECLVEASETLAPGSSAKSLLEGDCKHRTYALALACTGEYAQFHGGTKPLVLAAYNVAMTRVNGIYEREFAVTMVMVPNTDLLIYLNANTDPYTNNDGGTMLGQNQTTCDNVIGNANYDIGHVFSTGGGGVAYLNAVCSNNIKAGGVTGLPSPIGDPFYVDYVSHEMGHQFGGNHTQNNDCNRNGATAMEPGSASTIMGYAGICAPDVQNNSDDYFHAINLDEMHAHITGAGNSCATTVVTGNNAPTVTVGASSYTVPVSTPFVLTAQGVDTDPADALTYCWEQMNNQVATMPPLSTNTGGPAFRSLDPATSPSRYFPNLPAVIANTTPTWEVLPSVSRTMSFRCTVRDNHPGAGCSDETDVFLTVNASAGPFVVTNPNTSAITWTGGSTATVSWNVANTNLAPVSASQVEILLSADGGLTYPYTLLATTANDGSEVVNVPNISTTTARVMVKAKNNVFFDISNQNFKIQLAVIPSFTLQVTPSSAAACQSGEAGFVFTMLQLAGFNLPVNFTATGVPAGATVQFNPNGVAPPATVTMTVANLQNVPPGTYNITVTATGGTVTQTSNVQLTVLDVVTAAALLSSPTNGAEVTIFQPTLTWGAVANATQYLVEVSDNPSFSSLFASGTVSGTSFTIPVPCAELGVYYWRVTAINDCSASGFSQTFAFHLGEIGCQTFTATNLPLVISDIEESTVTTTMNVPVNQSISSLQMGIDIDHTYVGDLGVELISPQNTIAEVFNRPGVPASGFGCDGDDITANFSDAFANTAAVFESTCLNATPTISGNFQPMEPFASFIGENAQGTWTLRVTDYYPDDGGAVNTWTLGICGLVPTSLAVLLENNILNVPQAQDEIITQTYLQAQGTPTGDVIFTLLSVPANGTLSLGGLALGIGGTFTQADIDTGILVYQHDGSMTTSDEFLFDLYDSNGNWLHAQVFLINILQNTLAASASLTQEIDCNGDADAEITVAASGGTAPLEFSLNGGAAQSSNVFTDLGPGTFTIEVTDANGFTITTNSVTIVSPSALTASAAVLLDDITVTASGGTGSLQYSLNGMNFQPGNEFLNQPNGMYTVTVMDENGCTATATAVVAVNTLVVTASATQAISCFGENDAEITVNAAGGSAPYTYSLNGGAFQSSNVFTNLAPGVYTATVMDADGFTQTTGSMTLTNPAQLTASATVTGDSITVTASGGTGGLQYSIGGAFQAGTLFGNLPNGTYTITVSDANGCTATATATIAVNTLIVAASITQAIACFGENGGQITVTASGGMPAYEYNLNGGSFQSSNVFSGLAAGTYTVTVMDADGFTQTTLPVTIVSPSQISGSASAAGYTVTVTASGGTGALEYSLDGGAFQSGSSFFPVANGNHTITVSDENGCETTLSVTVAVQPLAVSGSISQPVSCANSTDGEITALGTGGVPGYEFSLNGGAFQSSNVFSDLAPGTYTLTIQDSGGFTVSSSTVVLSAPLALVVSPIAAGSTVAVNASGGTPSYQYQLDNGAFQTSNIFSNVSNGTHTITVVDANGCETTAGIFVGGVPPNIFVSIAQPVSCHGASDAVIQVGASGGTPPYLYSLNGGPFQGNNLFSGLAAGSYTVSVMGADGGAITAPAVVIPDPTALSVTASAFGLTITATGTGGTGSYEYSLDGVNFDDENELEVPGNGTYTVTILDEHGCTAQTAVTVNAPVGLSLDIAAVSCAGENDGQITITGVTGGEAPYLYSVNGGTFSSQTVYTGLAPGNYTITVQDATGYEFEAPTVVVEEPDAVEATLQLIGNDLTINASGGTGQLMYSIDGGATFQTSNVFNDLPNGTYEVVVMDENGCTFETTVMVNVNATHDQIGNLSFEVLPNPGDGLFTLKMDLPTFSTLDLSVYDVAGRRLFAGKTEASGQVEHSLDLRFLASGAYLLKVGNGEVWGVRRLVVVR